MNVKNQGEWRETLRDGTEVLIRPINKDDAVLERDFIAGLSLETRYFRFLDGMKTPSPELIRKLTDVDQRDNVAYIALVGEGAAQREIGVCRYCVDEGGEAAEFAVTVGDAWQHKGLATLLMRHLTDVARARGLKRLYSLDAADNLSMRDFAQQQGLQRHTVEDDATLVTHTLML